MSRCTACGALLGPNADWCGQCYSPVRGLQAEQPESPILRETPAAAPTVSPNGASAAARPAGAPPPAPPPPAPPPAGTDPPLPPDLLISLAAAGSSRSTGLVGPRGRNWITAIIIVVAVGTDALFFPYAKYMVAYGALVGAISAFALWRLWAATSVR